MSDVRRCSCPGCSDPALYEVVATDAGDNTGNTFWTCERHASPTDFRRPAGVADEA